jgi:hypothetical protein
MLLLRYAPSVPPENDLAMAARQPGARGAIESLMGSSEAQEAWPGAIIALGMITGPHHFGETHEKLIQFMYTEQPFGCSSSACAPLGKESTTRYWDRQARLAVPISLGYLIRRAGEAAPPPADVTDTSKLIIRKLTGIAKAPSSKVLISACVMSPDTAPSHAKESIESCNVQLQMNAIHGLKECGLPEAIDGLRDVAKHGQNALVVQEAATLLSEHSPHALK